MIVEATPFIIPFAMEVIQQPDYLDKAAILNSLALTAWYAVHGVKSVREMRLSIATYDALMVGFDTFWINLEDNDARIRKSAVSILSCFQERAVSVLDRLIDRYEAETDLTVRLEIVHKTGVLLVNSKHYIGEHYSEYRNFIVERMQPSHDIRERFGAATIVPDLYYSLPDDVRENIDAITQEYERSLPTDPIEF
ncbi:MAG: hypothetical protein AAFU54_03755 [Chloroflexota bacterium]